MANMLKRLGAMAAPFALLLGVQNVAAGPILLTATPTDAVASLLGGFTVTFDDTNGNGMLDMSEVTAFSGMTSFFAGPPGTAYELLVGVPNIPGIAVVSPGHLNPSLWEFQVSAVNDDGLGVGSGNYTYQLSEVTPTTVPEPSALALAGLALAGLGFARRTAARRARPGCRRTSDAA